MDAMAAFSGEYSKALVNKAQERRVPLSGTFELLPMCNMRCRMCYIQHTMSVKELLPADFWIELYKQAIDEGMLFVLLTGGEPLIYPEFERLYERLVQLPVYICLNTNGTLLDRERVKWLAKHPPRRVNISLYGTSDETYDRLCGNPKGFTQVKQAFDLLKEYGISFKMNSVLVPENVGDYQSMVEFARSYGQEISTGNYMFPPYRKDGYGVVGDVRFTPQEMARQSMANLSCRFNGNKREYARYVLAHCAAIEDPKIYSLYGNNEVACKAGKCAFWVDWRGNLSGCGVHNQPQIDLKETNFADGWRQVVDHTNEMRISEKCKFCKYRCICQVCPAACFCETGSLSGTPQYLCDYCEEYAKLLFEERERLLGKA